MKICKYKGGFFHWCPACGHAHRFDVPHWTWDGNEESPSCKPSMRVFLPAFEEDGVKHPEKTLCHYYLTDGKLIFQTDSAHAMGGQTVPLPDFPENYSTPSDAP